MVICLTKKYLLHTLGKFEGAYPYY